MASITQSGHLLDALTQSYNENTATLAALKARIAVAQETMAVDREHLDTARLALRHQALTDYMDDAGPNALTALFSGSTESAAMQEYRTLAVGDENAAIAHFTSLSRASSDKAASLARDEAAISAALDQIAKDRQNAQAAASAQQALLVAFNASSGPAASAFAAIQRAGSAALNALGEPGSTAAVAIPAAVLAALAHAGSQLAVPYVWGGESPGSGAGAGFDCSGLVQWAYGEAGITLPRTADQQYQATSRVVADQLRPGDLVFWNDGTPAVQHVAIYVGAGIVLQAPATGLVVSFSPIWPDGLVGFGRPALTATAAPGAPPPS